MLIATVGLLSLTAIWLPPGVLLARRVKGSAFIVVAASIFIAVASQAKTVLDVTPDRRNSFALTDEQLLGQLPEQLLVMVHMASSDPRVTDLDRKVLARLKRAMPRVVVKIAEEGSGALVGTAGGEDYGEIVFTYHGRSATTRSTGAGEILPMLYELAGVGLPAPGPAGPDQPGYPLGSTGRPRAALLSRVGPPRRATIRPQTLAVARRRTR